MKRTYTIIAILAVMCVAIGAGALWYSARNESEGPIADMRGTQNVSVVLTDAGFQPDQIRITKGTKVTFTTTRSNQFWPASNPHPSHEIYPQFDPRQPIDPGSSWTFTFDQIGAWGYHDHIRSYFRGIIYVEP